MFGLWIFYKSEGKDTKQWSLQVLVSYYLAQIPGRETSLQTMLDTNNFSHSDNPSELWGFISLSTRAARNIQIKYGLPSKCKPTPLYYILCSCCSRGQLEKLIFQPRRDRFIVFTPPDYLVILFAFKEPCISAKSVFAYSDTHMNGETNND